MADVSIDSSHGQLASCRTQQRPRTRVVRSKQVTFSNGTCYQLTLNDVIITRMRTQVVLGVLSPPPRAPRY
jgi:hypothetical protein